VVSVRAWRNDACTGLLALLVAVVILWSTVASAGGPTAWIVASGMAISVAAGLTVRLLSARLALRLVAAPAAAPVRGDQPPPPQPRAVDPDRPSCTRPRAPGGRRV
jgi:hypothetical protein